MIPLLLLLFLFLLFSILIFNFSLRRRTELCRFLDILPPVASVFWVWVWSVCLCLCLCCVFWFDFCFCGWVLLFVFDVVRCCYSFLWRRGLFELFFSLPTPISLDSNFLCTQAASQAPRPVLSLSPREGENCICLARALVLSFSQNLKNDSESCLCDPGNCSSPPCFFFFFFDRTKPRSLSLSLSDWNSCRGWFGAHVVVVIPPHPLSGLHDHVAEGLVPSSARFCFVWYRWYLLLPTTACLSVPCLVQISRILLHLNLVFFRTCVCVGVGKKKAELGTQVLLCCSR